MGLEPCQQFLAVQPSAGMQAESQQQFVSKAGKGDEFLNGRLAVEDDSRVRFGNREPLFQQAAAVSGDRDIQQIMHRPGADEVQDR